MNLVMRATVSAAVTVCCSLLWGCDDDDELRTIAAKSATRVAWNQGASSFRALSGYGFIIHVDGQPSQLTDVRCDDTPRGSEYPCSAALPPMPDGRSELTITTVAGRQASSPSERVWADVGSFRASTTTSASRYPGAAPPLICLDANRRECYAIQLIAGQLGPITAITAIDDDRVLFIEDGSRVRVVERGALVATPSLVAGSGVRFVGMAADTSFSSTRTIFVASTEEGRNGEELVVTRFRELAGVLGEPATILSGVRVPSGESAALGVDAAGLLYISVPGEGSPAAGTSLNGAVLRVTRDGFVPPHNRAGSPIVGRGHQRPWMMAVDSSREQLWLAGRGGEGRPVARLTLAGLDTGTWPRAPEPISAFAPGTRPTSVGMTPAPASSLFVVADGAVARVVLDHDGHVRTVEQLVGPDARGEVTAVVSAGTDLYASVRPALAREALVRLVRQ